jgi:hypothetical protein
MIVLVEMLNAAAAPLEVLLPPLLPPPPHAAKTSAPAPATAASLAELRTFHIGLDRLAWVISGRRVAASLGKRSLRPDGWLDRATARYDLVGETKYRAKGLSSIRDPEVVFAQTSEFWTHRKARPLTSSFCLVFAL